MLGLGVRGEPWRVFRLGPGGVETSIVLDRVFPHLESRWRRKVLSFGLSVASDKEISSLSCGPAELSLDVFTPVSAAF